MQKQLLLLCAVLVLTTASPHYYRQHYQYEQQSESYKNNELQHKKEEAGRYAKIEDGTSAPIERSAFHQSEYHAPGADDDSSQARLSLTDHAGSGTGNTQRYQQQSAFRRDWTQQNAGTSGATGNGGSGIGNPHHTYGHGHGYGHHGHRSQISGTGTASQSLTSATSSGSQGIYGSNTDFVHPEQTHHGRSHGYGHHRHHSQSLTGDSTTGQFSGTGTASQSLSTSESQGHITNRRYGGILQTSTVPTSYPGNIRVVPVTIVSSTIPKENPEISSVVPTSHRREWHHQTSYNNEGTNQHPGRGHGYGVGHQTGRGYHHNHGIAQTVDTTRSESHTQQKLEGAQHIVQVGDVDHGHHGHSRGHGRGRGHYEHGRGHGHGHHTTYPQRQYSDFNDNENTNTQTGQVSGTGTTFHSTSSGTNTAALNSGTAFYSESTGTNTASQSKLIGDSHLTGTNTNRQYPDTDDSSPAYGTVPLSGVAVPSSQSVGTGTVTHQTSRTYSVSQSKLSGTTIPQTTDTTSQINRNYGGPGRPYLILPTGSTVNQGNIRTTTENIKPVYEPEPEPEEPSISDKERLKSIFEEVNRIAQEDASLVKESQTTDVIQKPVQVQQRPTTNQQAAHQSRTIWQSGYTRTDGQTQQKVEDLTQQKEDDYNNFNDKQETQDFTQQTEDDYDDLTQQSQHGFDDMTQQTQQSQHGFDDMTQQTQQVPKEYNFAPITTQQKPINLNKPKIDHQQERTYTSHQTHNVFGKLDSKDLTQQTENEYDDLTQQTENEFDDLTQQSQHGFDDLTGDDTTQEIQKEFTPINPQPERTYTSRQTQRQYQTQHTQHGFDDTAQVQKEFKFTPINTHQKPINLDKPKIDNQPEGPSRQTQRLYQTQVRVEKTEFAAQPQAAVTPAPAAGYRPQQSQTGYGKLEFSGHQHEDDQEDLTQQHEDVFSQQQDLTQQHQDGFRNYEFNTQQTQNKFDKIGHVQQREDITQQTQDGFGQISAGHQYQQPQYSSGRVVKITQQNQDLTKQSQIDLGKLEPNDKYEDLSQKIDDLGTVSNTNSKVQGSGYSSSSSYSRSSSFAAQQQPQVVYSPMHIGSKSGQMQVYQTMQIPAGASEEMKRNLEEQLKRQLELKMQELQSQHHSSQYSMSPVHIGTQSGTGQLQVYQTMQIPAGASQELKHKLEEQLRQQLEQKMQELRMQQHSRTELHQSSSQPLLVQTYSTGEGADCDDQTGGSVSSSYSSSSSAGAVGGSHYSMQLRPASTVSSSDSSFQMTRQMQHPSSGYSY